METVIETKSGSLFNMEIHPCQKLVKRIRMCFETDDETKIFISIVQITFTFVALALSIISVTLSTATVRRQLTFQQAQKQADMTYRFEQRYEEMVVNTKGLLEKGEISIDAYIYAYWGIQYDQFVMNTNNSLLQENFNMWMRYRYYDWIQNDKIKYMENGTVKFMPYRETFERTIKRFEDPQFERFYREVVFKGKFNQDLNADETKSNGSLLPQASAAAGSSVSLEPNPQSASR